jgi:uncharacterized repeat protein (TIGR03803 family)
MIAHALSGRPKPALPAVVFGLALAASGASAQTYTPLHFFTATEGVGPQAGVIRASDGYFYGTADQGGGGLDPRGSIFRMDASGAIVITHTFQSGDPEGNFPRAGVIQASDGNFYGINSSGGASLLGTIFKMTPAGAVSLLHAFVLSDGGVPLGGLVEGRDGNLYGTTSGGGSTCPMPCTNQGTIFKVTKSGTFTWLHDFVYADGYGVQAALIQASDNAFYGTTTGGGGNGYGTVFKITSDGTFTVVHSFIQSGGSPFGSQAPVMQAANGSFYGTTVLGGANGTGMGGFGTVFKLDLDGTYTTLHSFADSEGINPEAGLIQGPDGNFYGTTSAHGGAGVLGTIFKMDPLGAVTVLHNFAAADGWHSTSGLVRGAGGNLYGTTMSGGSSTGVVYRIHVTTMGTPSDDFDGDGQADVTVYRPSTGIWWSLNPSNLTFSAHGWGDAGDVPVAGDYDGDGKVDPAIFRPSTGTWWILNSSTNYTTSTARPWGQSGDTPVPADYDGDGKADLGVYRAGVWWILKSSTGYTTYSSYTWGVSTDIPVPADYDGDGKTDLAVYRPSTGTWFILKSSTGYSAFVPYNWGISSDVPVVGDYDGDGKADLAVFRPSTGTWFILKSGSGYAAYVAYNWGVSSDVPVVGDFDGDGKADVTVYRPSAGIWWILKSSSNFTTYAPYGWGAAGDTPIGERP